MSRKAAITVLRSRDELQRLWQSSKYRPEYIEGADAAVTFVDAPGDRGTEIHVQLGGDGPSNKLAAAVQRLVSSPKLAKVKDELRRFKQLAETGEIPRSEGMPSGEQVQKKFKPRPAQPLSDDELHKAGVR
jgi:uncharacterized membrane protein